MAFDQGLHFLTLLRINCIYSANCVKQYSLWRGARLFQRRSWLTWTLWAFRQARVCVTQLAVSLLPYSSARRHAWCWDEVSNMLDLLLQKYHKSCYHDVCSESALLDKRCVGCEGLLWNGFRGNLSMILSNWLKLGLSSGLYAQHMMSISWKKIK